MEVYRIVQKHTDLVADISTCRGGVILMKCIHEFIEHSFEIPDQEVLINLVMEILNSRIIIKDSEKVMIYILLIYRLSIKKQIHPGMIGLLDQIRSGINQFSLWNAFCVFDGSFSDEEIDIIERGVYAIRELNGDYYTYFAYQSQSFDRYTNVDQFLLRDCENIQSTELLNYLHDSD